MSIVYTIVAMIVSYFVLPGSWSFWIILLGSIGVYGLISDKIKENKRNAAVDNEAKFQLDVEKRKHQIKNRE